MIVVAEVPGADARRDAPVDRSVAQEASPVAVLLASTAEDKVTLVAGISRDLQARGINAGDWVSAAAEVVGGRGGGRPDMAQAGGKHPEKLGEAMRTARADIEKLLTASPLASGGRG